MNTQKKCEIWVFGKVQDCAINGETTQNFQKTRNTGFRVDQSHFWHVWEKKNFFENFEIFLDNYLHVVKSLKWPPRAQKTFYGSNFLHGDNTR